ncbi:MAG: AAA family ATPase, partial [Pantoea sp.]|nr:AAA family ATPase [Pantoea sp.]
QQAKYQQSQPDNPTPETDLLLISQSDIAECWHEIAGIYVAPTVEQYIVNLVEMTRHPDRVSEAFASYISLGVSPRGTLALDRCGRACAWLDGRDAVLPEDIQRIAPAVLRHRLLLSYQANADNCTPDQAIAMLLDAVVA